MSPTEPYRIYLADWETALPNLCEIIKAPYSKGEFSDYEEHFVSQSLDEQQWKASGRTGCTIIIFLEKYEGYFLGELEGSGVIFSNAAQLLWHVYLEQRGNPNAQILPPQSL